MSLIVKNRERFERTDVPEPSPRRNLIGAIVAVAALAVTALVVFFAWNRASLESRMGDRSLSDAVATLAQYDESNPPKGYALSEDDISYVLLLTADSLNESGGTLTGARILALNSTQGTAALVNVPADLALTVDDAPTTLAELFSSQGYAACVTPLGRAAGVNFDSVILATGDVIEEAAQIAGSGAENLVRSASGLLSKIRTNLDATGLLALAEQLASVGTSNLATSDAPLTAETTTDEDGNTTETGRQVLDVTQTGVALGRFVAAE